MDRFMAFLLSIENAAILFFRFRERWLNDFFGFLSPSDVRLQGTKLVVTEGILEDRLGEVHGPCPVCSRASLADGEAGKNTDKVIGFMNRSRKEKGVAPN